MPSTKLVISPLTKAVSKVKPPVKPKELLIATARALYEARMVEYKKDCEDWEVENEKLRAEALEELKQTPMPKIEAEALRYYAEKVVLQISFYNNTSEKFNARWKVHYAEGSRLGLIGNMYGNVGYGSKAPDEKKILAELKAAQSGLPTATDNLVDRLLEDSTIRAKLVAAGEKLLKTPTKADKDTAITLTT